MYIQNAFRSLPNRILYIQNRFRSLPNRILYIQNAFRSLANRILYIQNRSRDMINGSRDMISGTIYILFSVRSLINWAFYLKYILKYTVLPFLHVLCTHGF